MEVLEIALAISFADPDRQGAQVKVTEAPVSFSTAPQRFEFADLKKHAGKIESIVDRAANSDKTGHFPDYIKRFGTLLFKRLFPEDSAILKCIEESFTKAELDSRPLRFKLEIDDDLSDFPWEWLYKPPTNRDKRELFLVHGPECSLIRNVGTTPRAQVDISKPVRMLIITADPKQQDPKQQLKETIKQECAQLQQLLEPAVKAGLLEIRMVEGEATLHQLSTLNQEGYRPNIIHVIGHGTLGVAGLYLELESASGGIDTVPYTRIRPVMKDLSRNVVLMVLNTCRLGRDIADHDNDDSSRLRLTYPQFATQLVRDLGVPAVIAMKFLISSPAAEAFSAIFYQELFSCLPADRAFGRACLEIYSREDRQGEWGTPVLFAGAALNQAMPGLCFDDAKTSIFARHVEIPADNPDQPFVCGFSEEQISLLLSRFPQIKNWRAILNGNRRRSVSSPLPRYKMDSRPVTNRAFRDFVEDGLEPYRTDAENKAGSKTWKDWAGPGREDHPVVCVTLKDANAFCQWRSRKEKRTVGLPTMDQFEKASREGLKDERLYPWGNDFNSARCRCGESGVEGTESVYLHNTTDSSPRGVKLLGGNVAEWTKPEINGDQFTFGGSWATQCELYSLVSLRHFRADPSTFRADLGFRCVWL